MPKDTSAPTDTGKVNENDAAKEAPLPKHTGKGMQAMQGFSSPDMSANAVGDTPANAKPDKPPKKTESLAEEQPGSFQITDWSGYPDGPKPEGPFKIREGEEYESARALANQTNRGLHQNDPSLKGLAVHEVHPVKFGGSPTDLDNKIYLEPPEHAKYTTWWNNVLKSQTSG